MEGSPSVWKQGPLADSCLHVSGGQLGKQSVNFIAEKDVVCTYDPQTIINYSKSLFSSHYVSCQSVV